MEGQRLEFRVKGSAPEPYWVTFVRPGAGALHAYCTCPAGSSGQYCKHRFSILEGSDRGVVSDNVSEIEQVVEWLKGTELEAVMARMRELEDELAAMKRTLSDRKKQVARVMRGQP